MGKRVVYSKIHPLPSNIPRQLALDLLHNHDEYIRLNPLVTDVKAVDAPRDAASDEFFSQWYEITEVITWGIGFKKKISFKGVFHDQPWGLQTHVYAPMGVDLRNKYRIGGNQPGEPREQRELGVDIPADGLYLREDVEIVCSVPLTASFVKKETKAAILTMINRLTRKAELLDEGKLHAMFEAGKLKTAKPSADPTFADRPSPSLSTSSPLGSPGLQSASTFSPAVDEKGFSSYHDAMARRESKRVSGYMPAYQQAGYRGPEYARPGAELPADHGPSMPFIAEMPGSFYQPEQSPGMYPQPLKPQGQSFRSELPGDFTMPPPQPSMDSKPPGNYPAYPQTSSLQPYPHQHGSPQPSPGLPDRNSSHGSGKYQITNADPPATQHPAYRHSSQENNLTEWQRNAANTAMGDPARNSRTSGQFVEPDHQRFSALSIQNTPVQQKSSPELAQKPAGRISRCPVCMLFEGDEAAITHHVTKAHFN